MPENLEKICALICAYNEQRTIGRIVTGAKKYINPVIVVDDGSRDRTAVIALEAGAKLLQHRKNLGKGSALKTGLDYFFSNDFDAIVTLDADGQHLPEEIPLLINKLNEGYDVVIGSRNYSEMPFTRRLANKLSSLVYRLRTGTRLNDTQSGFRAFKTEVLENITTVENGYMAEFELLVRFAQAGYKITEVDIQTIYSAEIKSKIKPLQQIYRFLKFNFLDFFNYDLKNIYKDKGYIKNLARAKLKRGKI